jgi:ADP-ribosyl-[dinitrogen reductase] hydrolase
MIFSTELEVVQEVLRVFRQTNNFVEGLRIIVNESVLPNWAGALYGQLAGAYYGLTDIPESWMDVVQDSEA